MRFLQTALSAFVVMIAGCASTPAPAPVAPQPAVVGEAEIGVLADVLRREDNRQFDAAALQAAVGAPTETVRMIAVRALGRIGDRAASALLVTSLGDRSARVRAEAAFALGELGDSSETVVTALSRILQSREGDAVEAVAALGKIRTAAARHYVEYVLTAGAPAPVLQEALLAIWRFPRTTANTQIIARYTQHADEQIRWAATYALTRGLADPAVVPQLIALLRDGAGYTASFAARGLRAVSVDSAGQRAPAIAVLSSRINDAFAPVRINAITALGGEYSATLGAAAAPCGRQYTRGRGPGHRRRRRSAGMGGPGNHCP
jgi:HEAT repeat protein